MASGCIGSKCRGDRILNGHDPAITCSDTSSRAIDRFEAAVRGGDQSAERPRSFLLVLRSRSAHSLGNRPSKHWFGRCQHCPSCHSHSACSTLIYPLIAASLAFVTRHATGAVLLTLLIAFLPNGDGRTRLVHVGRDRCAICARGAHGESLTGRSTAWNSRLILCSTGSPSV